MQRWTYPKEYADVVDWKAKTLRKSEELGHDTTTQTLEEFLFDDAPYVPGRERMPRSDRTHAWTEEEIRNPPKFENNPLLDEEVEELTEGGARIESGEAKRAGKSGDRAAAGVLSKKRITLPVRFSSSPF